MALYRNIAAAAVLIAGLATAQAQTNPRQGGPIGQPEESNQAAERDAHGAPHGSSVNPSPHGPGTAGATTGQSRRTDPRQGGSPEQPLESGQAAERDVHGSPHGSSRNPSPH